MPSLGGDVEPWRVDVYYENDTRFRGKDKSGDRVGLSKFRNTLQVEADKKVGDGWAVRASCAAPGTASIGSTRTNTARTPAARARPTSGFLTRPVR
ncbi:MAG: hypothetical protein IPF74_04775 [Rhodocyclaceae bacterium]|nr:hypothetical protein [Rhodocyclaceae bacterium]